jgi:serine/threonine protein kinase/DNA-binding beta-propeller fold protein YncE
VAEISIGSVLAGYRIEGLAGEGGMGRVYRATQMGLNRQVALKLIMPELATEPDFRARFERESRLTASIEHPNVIPVYEAGDAEGQLFIAMRWVEGTDMRSVILTEGRLEADRAIGIVEQVAAALDAAHSGGLVHRDVKPANVMLTTAHGQEHVYLTDFGLTKRAGSGTALTRTGAFVGTPDYMPPEQIKGERSDARTDVYALGCLLFHALTGRTPYDRDTEVAKMYAQLHDEPPSAAEAVPGTPTALDAVIARALAKDADERYLSAGDLGRAARAALIGKDPSQPERSLATGLAAPPTELSPAASAPPDLTAATPPPGPTAATPPPGETAATPPPPAAQPPAPQPPSAEPPAAPPPASPPPAATPPPAPQPAAAQPPAPPARAASPPSRALPIAFVALLVLGVVAAALAVTGVFSGGDGDDGGGSFSDQSADTADQPTAPKILEKSIPAGEGPDGIAVDGTTVWVSNSRGGTLTRISTKTNKQIGEPISVGENPDEVEARDGVVWVANTDDDNVTRYEDGEQQAFTVGDGPEGLSLGDRFLWVANGNSDSVSRIDLGSGAVTPIGVGRKPIGIYAGKRFVWVTNSFSRSVTRLDPATGAIVDTIDGVGKNIRAVTEAFGFAWVSSADSNGMVMRLDPDTGEVLDRIKVGQKSKEMVAAGGFLWVVNETSGNVVRIDPEKAAVVGDPIDVRDTPVGLAVGAGDLWVSNNRSDDVTRIDPGSSG